MLKKRVFAFALTVAIMATTMPMANALESTEVNVWLSTVNSSNTGMDKALSSENSIYFVEDNGNAVSNLIVVDESKEYQEIDGFGASITEASAHLYQDVLESDDKNDVMNALFDVETSLILTLMAFPASETEILR